MPILPASVLADLLNVRLVGATLEELLERYLQIVLAALPEVEEASITLLRGDKPFTASYTGELALAADELQYQRGYGPCIDAGMSGSVLAVADMREEDRWPDYATAVAEHGVLSSLSVPLPLQTDLIGALNCYSRSAGALGEAHDAAVGLSAHIAAAIANAVTYTDSARLAADMQSAMLSRAVIEQAKGAIMVQNRCSPDQAFDVLRRASMGRNLKLRDLATMIVAGLSAPPGADPGRHADSDQR